MGDVPSENVTFTGETDLSTKGNADGETNASVRAETSAASPTETFADTSADKSPDTQRANTEEQEFLMRSLDDLDREFAAGDISEHDYRTLRAEYIVRTADALRDPKQPTKQPSNRTRSPMRAAVTAMAVLGVAIGSGIFVAQSAGQRVEGEGLTGTVRSPGGPTTTRAQTPGEIEIEKHLNDGRSMLGSDPVGALKAYDAALAINPKIPEALAYSGWVLRLASRSAVGADADELIAGALRRIDAAIAADSTYPDARAFRGIILLRDLDRPADASKEFAALDVGNTPPFITQLIESARSEANETPSSGSSP
jgi:tetratricopeptide (TPR) repeat protein